MSVARIAVDPEARRALCALRRSRSVLVTSHVNPDGDAMGSMLGLAAALESRGKRVAVVLDDEVPASYRFLPGAERVARAPVSPVPSVDLAVILDCGGMDRIGRAGCGLPPDLDIVNIDHHGTNTRFGTVNWVDRSAAAVGEQVYWLLGADRLEIDPGVATCLFTAISTDTGSFKYENTTARSLAIAARLVEAGADLNVITEQAFETKSLGNLKLLGAALTGLEVGAGGKLAWMAVTRKEMQDHGVGEAETEGFPSYPRMIPGVAVGMFFRETADAKVKVAFRSHGEADVAALAARFGGGGHPCAAGCVVEGDMERVKKLILEAAANAVKDTRARRQGG